MPSAQTILNAIAPGLLTAGPDELWSQALADGWRPDELSTSAAPGLYCHRCGISAGFGAVTAEGCSFCRGQNQPWDHIVRLGPYTDPLRTWLTAMKFHREWSWCTHFARELATRLITREPAPSPAPSSTSAIRNPQSDILLCPVPMHWLRRCTRGYNQAHLLADALARELHWPCANLLRRVRRTRPQPSVPMSQRTTNIRGSFALRAIDATGWDIWLVDDIKTTGATLAACSRLLRQAGARSVNVAVVAVADPPQIRSVAQ